MYIYIYRCKVKAWSDSGLEMEDENLEKINQCKRRIKNAMQKQNGSTLTIKVRKLGGDWKKSDQETS